MKALFLSSLAAMTIMTTSCNYNNVAPTDPEAVDESYVHKYGVTVSKDDWEERGEDGQIVSVKKDGTKIARNYRNGRLEGETTFTFPHSEAIHRVHAFREGKLTKEVLNYSTGLPMKQEEYLSPNSSVITLWYESGSPHSIERYENNRLVSGYYYTPTYDLESEVANGCGTRIIRNQYGETQSNDCIVNGQMSTRTTYHTNKAVESITAYENGEISGIKRTYLPDGEPNTIEEWSNGRQNGITTQFRNGEKIAEIPYVKGIKEGIEVRFKDGAHISEEISWRNDSRHGLSKLYIGDNTKLEWFQEGRPVSKLLFEQLNGAMR